MGLSGDGGSGGEGDGIGQDYMRVRSLDSPKFLVILFALRPWSKLFLQPTLHGHSHFVEMAFEEMVAGNEH